MFVIDGACVAQIGIAFGHRVWNRQPDGGDSGEGRSPVSRSRSAASPLFKRGAAAINARV